MHSCCLWFLFFKLASWWTHEVVFQRNILVSHMPVHLLWSYMCSIEWGMQETDEKSLMNKVKRDKRDKKYQCVCDCVNVVAHNEHRSLLVHWLNQLNQASSHFSIRLCYRELVKLPYKITLCPMNSKRGKLLFASNDYGVV